MSGSFTEQKSNMVVGYERDWNRIQGKLQENSRTRSRPLPKEDTFKTVSRNPRMFGGFFPGLYFCKQTTTKLKNILILLNCDLKSSCSAPERTQCRYLPLYKRRRQIVEYPQCWKAFGEYRSSLTALGKQRPHDTKYLSLLLHYPFLLDRILFFLLSGPSLRDQTVLSHLCGGCLLLLQCCRDNALG